MRRLMLLLILVAMIIAAPAVSTTATTTDPCDASLAPLLLFLGATAGDLNPGDTFTVTASIYSTSHVTLTGYLDRQTDPGLMDAKPPMWSTHQLSCNHPITVVMTYKIRSDAPRGGAIINILVVARDSAGHMVKKVQQIMVGHRPWPDPKPPAKKRIYLPIVRR